MKRPRWGAGLVAVPALALALWLVYGSGFVDYDALYALIWGDDLAGGHRPPDIDARHSPTSHPLATALSAPVSRLGDGALGALQAISVVSFAALGWAGYRLGERLFGRAAGALFALILLTRPLLVKQALSANVDIPFLALVLGAAAMEARTPRRGWPVLALLALAGWLRPEAWLLALAYTAWLRPWATRDWRVVAAALGGPVGWALFDWAVAGDPLHSMSQTSSAADRIGRPQGVDRAVRLAPGYLADVLTVPVLIGGAGTALLSLRLARARARLPVALAVLGVLAFLILGLGDQPLLARYLFLPAAMLALFFAAGLAGRWSVAAAVALAIAAVISVPSTVRDVDEQVDVAAHRHDADGSLDDVLDRAPERCGPVAVTYFQTRPLVAYLLGRRPNRIDTTRAERAERGTLVTEDEPPPGFRRLAADEHWTVASRCDG